MTAETVYVGDVGTLLRTRLLEGAAPLDVSAATEIILLFRTPAGTCVSKPAAFATNGSDGLVQYATEADFLDVAGLWMMQAHVVMQTGEWTSDPVSFRVKDRLCSVS